MQNSDYQCSDYQSVMQHCDGPHSAGEAHGYFGWTWTNAMILMKAYSLHISRLLWNMQTGNWIYPACTR